MPASAYALIAVFFTVSVLAGIGAARLIGPWRWWTAFLPAAGAFGSLYLVGHRWVLSIGPDVELFGWDVALPFDIAVAVATAGVVALVQRAALGLLQAQQRRAGGDGLA
ncbi:MAG TPA: hypothetical protein VHQ42_07485 [Candidatus Limnocylindria bacterium]|nr:hypothetical protein [Candidatus Limnocylindria bacterium]